MQNQARIRAPLDRGLDKRLVDAVLEGFAA